MKTDITSLTIKGYSGLKPAEFQLTSATDIFGVKITKRGWTGRKMSFWAGAKEAREIKKWIEEWLD